MSEERTYDRVISTEDELEDMVREALVTGELNLFNCKVKVEFNLLYLLLKCGALQVASPFQNNCGPKYFISCPFTIDWNRSSFLNFSTKDTDGITSVVFEKNIYFGNVDFISDVCFWGAWFKNEVRFACSTFYSANFICICCDGILAFSDVKFIDEVSFGSAHFNNRTNFSQVTFSRTSQSSFLGCTFSKKASFEKINILNNRTLYFNHITTHDELEIMPNGLQGNIEITSPNLESEKRSLVMDFASCRSLISQGEIIFKGLETDHDRICLKVRNLKEDSNVTVHFEDCGFYGKNVAFTNVDMQQVNITGGNYVAGMAFYHCEWAKKPAFFGLEFRAFDGLKTEDIAKKAESYGNLKVSALDAGDAQLSNDFHFWHQWHQKKLFSWNWFYLHTSAYGLSVALPLIGFSLIYGIGVLLYTGDAFRDPWLTSLSGSFPLVLNEVEPIQNAIKHVATKMGGWFYPLYILQHLIQGYLLFQIGAAIRNKVKR